MAQDAGLTDKSLDRKRVSPIKPRKKYTYKVPLESLAPTPEELKRAAITRATTCVNKGIWKVNKVSAGTAPAKILRSIYQTPELLAEALEAYTESHKADKEDNIPTISGLALELGLEDKLQIKVASEDRSEEFKDYSPLLRKALTFIESLYESNMMRPGNNGGSIFWLKNRGWTDLPTAAAQSNAINIILSSPETAKALNSAVFEIVDPYETHKDKTTPLGVVGKDKIILKEDIAPKLPKAEVNIDSILDEIEGEI
jgi:hypothetical protein